MIFLLNLSYWQSLSFPTCQNLAIYDWYTLSAKELKRILAILSDQQLEVITVCPILNIEDDTQRHRTRKPIPVLVSLITSHIRKQTFPGPTC